VQKTSWQLRFNQQLQITEVDSVSIDEVIRLLKEIQDLGESAKTTTKKAKKVVKKVKRAPSAYNKYMKKKMAQLKKKHPRKKHAAIFKQAAKSWKRSPDRKRSLK